ncbi:MAG TPA: sigma-54-dependent Fis family transcriptional regulator [Bacteroidetes bacterium]|nr:sigma-54-dependent Fis family transcriptional regulator [Bacteroidota bacterium]
MQNIMIIDDEEDILDTLSDVVSKWGYLPIVARDGEDALKKFNEVPIDLILSDIRMPKMDGLSLLEKIKRLSPHTVIILLTGYPSIDTAVKAMKDGAFDYLTKPINLDELKVKIDRGLEKMRLNKSLSFLKGVNWSLIISIPIWLILGIILSKLLH